MWPFMMRIGKYGKRMKEFYPTILLRTAYATGGIGILSNRKGHFFEEVFKIAPEAEILSGSQHYIRKMAITKDSGNWEDWNAGSMMYPAYMSELCECGG